MIKKFTNKLGFTLGCLAALVVFALVCAISWITTCGFVYLITLCFGWSFSWAIATGVWLAIWLLQSIFKSNVTVKK